MSAVPSFYCTIAVMLVVVGPLACRRTETPEASPPAPEQPPPKPEPAPAPIKPVALDLSASGGCALDSAGELWCWGGYATRHAGLRASVGDDELLVATRIESAVDILDFAVTDTGVCWLGMDGIAQCHLADGLARYDLGVARSLVAASDTYGGDTVVVVQLDYETLNSNFWPEARTFHSVVTYDLAYPNLCVQQADHRVVCDQVWDEKTSDSGDVSGNAFTRMIAVGPKTSCLIEDNGTIECTPTFTAMSSNNPSRWIDGIEQAVTVDVGMDHACALEAGGEVVCFGGNAYAQRGVGTDGVATIDLPGPASAVAAAGHHSCAIVGDDIYCWGAPATGPADRWIARNDIPLGSTALHVSGNLNCVSRAEQTTVQVEDASQQSKVWCWGSPEATTLGWARAGIEGAAEPRPVALPMPDVDTLIGDCFGWRGQISCGWFYERGRHDAGLATEDFRVSFDGENTSMHFSVFAGFQGKEPRYCGARRKGATLRCSRRTDFELMEPVPSAPKSGTLVIGSDRTGCSFSPASLTCFDLNEGVYQPAHSHVLERIRALAAGELWWFALDGDGRVWMFEVYESTPGQLAISDPILVPIPNAIELGAFAGDAELCVRDAAGAVRCITRNEQGWSDVRVELEHGAIELDAGIAHACARVDADGDGQSESIHCWGDNRFAQLGSVGAQVVRTPTVVTKR